MWARLWHSCRDTLPFTEGGSVSCRGTPENRLYAEQLCEQQVCLVEAWTHAVNDRRSRAPKQVCNNASACRAFDDVPLGDRGRSRRYASSSACRAVARK
jgi:hypothetical protein